MSDLYIGLHHAKRSQDPSRPLFFIGHSLGGIVIKQVRCSSSISGWLGAILTPCYSTYSEHRGLLLAPVLAELFKLLFLSLTL